LDVVADEEWDASWLGSVDASSPFWATAFEWRLVVSAVSFRSLEGGIFLNFTDDPTWSCDLFESTVRSTRVGTAEAASRLFCAERIPSPIGFLSAPSISSFMNVCTGFDGQ
jgi:hypothetical protein